MNVPSGTASLYSFKTPAIRHLAWLCQAPQLLHSAISFQPSDYLPDNYLSTLMLWDQVPELAPPLLSEIPQKRLGFYFERLYQVLLESLLGWRILLKNQQIHAQGRTIGELDFVVYNPADNRTEHHEIAIKFYLGVPGHYQETLWYGPNAIDRLDLKTSQMLHHQSQRSREPEVAALLDRSGISGPVTPRIFIPGYLFHPGSQLIATPGYVPENYLRGKWMYLSEARQTNTSAWVPLNKPHWIGPWVQEEPPIQKTVEEALAFTEQHAIPQLFSILDQQTGDGVRIETDRVFVVPESWPKTRR
jgi:hypothetical protein